MKLFYCFFKNKNDENNKAQLSISLNLKILWRKIIVII